ncbi:O-antigen polymerase [Deinococcus deserti]|uniref:Oligosaccharide repeat unit polymerase n=1 Tax=Deinococcus deserti (strain DSM 17065 / CIP 109153 / LMG 22923 / VCD115) TaxID=546414 RepID=C1CYL3_DEIDV|nr:O-antigen polymerase [Deinococcus deserti]ACO47043.1 Hypothetical protein; putative membrane protein [Deinococcus deserti VCD115]
MLELTTLIAALTTLLLLNFFFSRDVRYPAVLQIIVWLVTLVVYVVERHRYVSLSESVMLIIFLGVLGFSAGSFLTLSSLGGRSLGSRKTVLLRMRHLSDVRLVLAFFLTLLAIAGAAVYIQTATQFAQTGPTQDLALNLRYLTSVRGEVPPLMRLTSYALPILNTLSGFCLIYYRANRDKRVLPILFLAVASALVMSVFSTGRGIILFFIIEMGIIYAMTSKRLRLRLVLLGLLMFLSIFYIGASVLGKGVDQNASLLESFPDLFSSISLYLLSGILALSVQLPTLVTDEGGVNTFRTIHALGRALGFDATVVPLVQAFTNIPQPTNVYTIYLTYLKDFGWLGIFIFQFLFGILHATLFIAFRRTGGAVALFWLAILSFPLLTQPFTDGYFSLMSTWIQYAFFSSLFSLTIFRSSSKASSATDVSRA